MDALAQARLLSKVKHTLDALRDGVFLSPYDEYQAHAKRIGLPGQEAIRQAALAIASTLDRDDWGALQADFARALTYDAHRLADLACKSLSIMDDV